MNELRQILDPVTDKLDYAKALLLEAKLLVKFAALGSALFIAGLLTKVNEAKRVFGEVVS